MATSAAFDLLSSVCIIRPGTSDDIPAMAKLAAEWGLDIRSVTQSCERVLREPYGFSLVAVARRPQEDVLIGFENGILLSEETSRQARESGTPYSRLLVEGKARLGPTEDELGRANAADGLDFLVSHYLFKKGMPEDLLARTMANFNTMFVETYVGNRVKSVLHEVRGIGEAQRVSEGPYELAETYDEWFATHGGPEATRPILIRSNREMAVARHNNIVVRFLSYHPPILRFPPAAREVLRCAYLGFSDSQIVARLGVTTPSLNSRWTRILNLAERKMPHMFERKPGEGGRDRQPLLAYVRNHPEELWPYEKGTVPNTRSRVGRE